MKTLHQASLFKNYDYSLYHIDSHRRLRVINLSEVMGGWEAKFTADLMHQDLTQKDKLGT